MNILETDILTIGSGAAGLTASVYAAEAGRDVLVIDKGAAGKSGSTAGAIQIAGLGDWTHEGDSEEAYAKDIKDSGRGLSHPVMAEILANEIAARLRDMVSWGLRLDRNEQKQVAVYATSGHSAGRSVSARKGKTGLGILQTLMKKARSLDDHLRTWSDVITLDLLISSSGAVAGAVVFDLTANKVFVIKAKTVILAAGGTGQLYPVTSNPVQSTGDGFSLGLGAGAVLVDMEQVQFYPVSLVKPGSLAGFCLSFYHYSKLYNRDGSRFMTHYEPDTMENTTRDKLAVAIASEVAAGRGTENGAVWLDAADHINRVKQESLHEYNLCLERGADLQTSRIEVGPAAHFMMGGIQIDNNGESSIPGLFVTGETAGGLHGGNRLGNNALSECLVFGARAGKAAAEKSGRQPDVNISLENIDGNKFVSSLLNGNHVKKGGSVKAYKVKDSIQQIMGNYAGVIRTDSGLERARGQLEEAEELLNSAAVELRNIYSREIIDYIEAHHMIRTAKAIVTAAAVRKESRGAHYNEDHASLSAALYHTEVLEQNERLICRRADVEGGR